MPVTTKPAPKRSTISRSLSWDPKVLAATEKAAKNAGLMLGDEPNVSLYVMVELRKLHRAAGLLK